MPSSWNRPRRLGAAPVVPPAKRPVLTLGTGPSHLESDTLRLYLEGCSYEQIAAEVGCDRKTIDHALQRVKRKVLTHRRSRQVLA